MEELLGSTWVEINLDSVKKNIQNINNLVGNQINIMGIVKGNAYGHDAVEISKLILEYGVNQLAVARIEEAVILRRNDIKVPILVLSVSPEKQMDLYFDYQIMPTISDLQLAKKFNTMAEKKGKLIKMHLKLETGMSRLGINPEEVVPVLREIKKMANAEVQGIYTHFSTADEADKEYTYYQFGIFKRAMNQIRKNNIDIPFFHVANSGTILDLPDMWLDMVRPGCLIYGLYPSGEVERTIPMYPALSFKSRISFIKKVSSNTFIGYGREYKTKKDTLVATLPVGYADGYSRMLSNRGKVLVKGIKVPVVGRVCMDQMMIDISDVPEACVGEEVVLWGEQKGETISIETIAEMLNTIVDEVVHLTDKGRVAKLFIKKNKPWKIKNMLGENIIDG